MQYPVPAPSRLTNLAMIVAGGFSVLLGLVVLAGWHFHNISMVKIDPSFVSMQYNTALGFLLSGIGFLSIAFVRPLPAMACGVIITLTGLLTLSEYVFSIDFGIDQLLIKDYINIWSPFPGRMAPNAALNFVLVGLSLMFMSKARFRHRAMILGLAGSVISVLSVVALLGYLTGIKAAYVWGPFIGMALHTASGFLALSLGVIAFARSEGSMEGKGLPRWLPYSVGIGILIATIFMWQSLRTHERNYIEQMTNIATVIVKNELIEQVIESRIFALVRMAKRWEVQGKPALNEWESDAGLYLSQYSGYHAIKWVDDLLHVRWIVSREEKDWGQELNLRLDGLRMKAMESAFRTREVSVTHPVKLGQGDMGFEVYVPIFRGNNFDGFIVGVFKYQELLAFVLDHIINMGFSVSVFDGEDEVYSRKNLSKQLDRSGEYRDKNIMKSEIDLYDVTWRVIVRPSPEFLSEAKTALPKVILFIGFVLSYLSAVSLHFARRSQLRANEAEEANLALKDEINRHEQTTKAFLESEERFRSILDTTPSVVFLKDIEGRFIFINCQFEKLFHISREQIKGKTDYDLFPKEMADVFRSNDLKVIETKTSMEVEENVPQDDGMHTYISVKFPLRDTAGVPYAVCGIATDITDRKRLEEQLLQSQKMEAIGTLAGGIAHDFNNILTAIIGYGSLLLMKMKEDDPLRVYVDTILASSEKGAGLNRSLLAFSRKQIINPNPVKLNEIVGNVEKILQRLIGEDIEFRSVLSDEDMTVFADSGQIEQVLMNLCTNARDAMPNGGLLTIGTEPVELDMEFIKAHGYGEPAKYVLLTVTDTGAGMDETIIKRIFEPFFTTKEMGKGTGLGLAMVYGIIKQHNGFINVYSDEGKGTTFKIYLPVFKPQSEVSVPQPEIRKQQLVTGGTETVLLAEDNEDVRGLGKELLVESGYKVIEANDGEDAIMKFMENKEDIQLVILDVIMPKKNGREVYDEIMKTRPDIKSLFMSGYTANHIHKKGILEEGLNFISKPVSPNEFLRKVREALDR